MPLGDHSHPGLGKSEEAAWNRKNLNLPSKEGSGLRKEHFCKVKQHEQRYEDSERIFNKVPDVKCKNYADSSVGSGDS